MHDKLKTSNSNHQRMPQPGPPPHQVSLFFWTCFAVPSSLIPQSVIHSQKRRSGLRRLHSHSHCISKIFSSLCLLKYCNSRKKKSSSFAGKYCRFVHKKYLPRLQISYFEISVKTVFLIFKRKFHKTPQIFRTTHQFSQI